MLIKTELEGKDMRFIQYTTVAFLCFMGCQEKESNTDSASEEAGASCQTLTVEECSSNSACSVITASSVNLDEQLECYSQTGTQEVGCRDAEETCAQEQIFASSGDGSCMLFSDRCTPDGWNICLGPASFDNCENVQSCSEADVSVCEDRDDCVVLKASSLTYDSDSECYDASPVEPVGCMDAGVGCSTGEYFANSSASEECMMFYNSCIPEGWGMCTEQLICAD